MNKLKSVVRAISPFVGRQSRSNEDSLYEESKWESKVANLDIRQFMQKFYSRYNPDKMHTIDFILGQFEGRENEMLLMLSDKYQVSRADMYAIMDKAQRQPGDSSIRPLRGAQPPPPPRMSTSGALDPALTPRPPVPPQAQLQVHRDGIRKHADEGRPQPTPSQPRGAEGAQQIHEIHSASGPNNIAPGHRGQSSATLHQPQALLVNSASSSTGGNRYQVNHMNHREVNQSLKGIILEVRSTNRPQLPSSTVGATHRPFKNDIVTSNNPSNLSKQSKETNTSTPEAHNKARLQAILDYGSDDDVDQCADKDGVSSDGEESDGESETDEEAVMKDSSYKYRYPEDVTVDSRHNSTASNDGLSVNTHPHLNRPASSLTVKVDPKMNTSESLSVKSTQQEVSPEAKRMAAELEQTKAALANSNSEKSEMLRLLEMMASNPRDMNGAIAEFIKQHENAGEKLVNPAPTTDGPFRLGHHSRFDTENERSGSSIGYKSRLSFRHQTDPNIDISHSPAGHSRVLNLSDLHGHHNTLEQDMASLASHQSGRSSRTAESRGRSGSAPHMRPTKASNRREIDAARDAKSSGRYVPYHDADSPTLSITRARSPAPGVSRANWTGVSASEKDLLKLSKRSTSTTIVYNGRAGNGFGFDSPSRWGEQPASSRAPSPSGYDFRRHNSRAASPTPSVRSMDSFGSHGSLNARNVATRYTSPSPSVRSNYSLGSGSQSGNKVPGRNPSSCRHRESSPGPSGGKIYFKETITNDTEKVTGNTNNSNFGDKQKKRSALLEEQYKLAKKYLDHGLEQARVSQKMAELNLKASSKKMKNHASDAVASVEHEKGQDDWVECCDPRTKRK